MNASDLQPFFDWAAAKANRSVDIKTKRHAPRELEVWVYDYDLMVGQFVTSIDDINLEQRAAEELERNTTRLRHIMESGKAKGGV